MKKLIAAFLIIYSISGFCQFSKVHYLPPVSNSSEQSVNDQYLYISSPNIIPVNFSVKNPNGSILFSATVSRNTPYVYRIGAGANTQMLIDKNDVGKIMTNKGFIIEADDLIYACLRFTSSPESYQAGSIVSKGLAAPGKKFRVGAFTNTSLDFTNGNHYTFATILALENNTEISFNIKTGVKLINNGAAGNVLPSIILNQGESYCFAVEGAESANRDGLIGALIDAEKKVVVNCGSFAGSNGDLRNLDLGMDQIVDEERIGQEYIFVKGRGQNIVERPLIVAHENGTEVFVNDDGNSIITLDAGQYIAINGSKFSGNGNMYVRTTKKAFAYQGIGGTVEQANQNMHFVPPLNCATPKKIDNIPFINQIGNNNGFTGTVAIVTEVGAVITFIIDGVNYNLSNLPSSINTIGPKSVSGNPLYETYNFTGLTGNISVFANKSLYLSYYGSSSFATYGGFYSGFTFNPEISFNNLSASQTGCIPFVKLEVNTISSFDFLKWFKNGVAISGATGYDFTPDSPGYYYVEGTINACGVAQIYKSDEIPVSICTLDSDNDFANDNIDLDLDNDAITNCAESFGDSVINTTNLLAGNINNSSTSFSGAVTTFGPGASIGNVTGNANSFVTQVPIGKGNKVRYELIFSQPISVELQYPLVASTSDLINSNSNFVANCDLNSTITVLNPSNQLLIDTNYDGVYESGITRFSSFEIRFRLNSSTPLLAGTGTFSFRSHLTKSFAITQENLSETAINKSTFSLIATCIPRDSDSDTVIDQLDLDSDNDGILDNIEFISLNNIVKSNLDSNFNGVDDAYDNLITSDFDNDGYFNFVDIDSDNDGIYDLVESGSNAIDANLDGIIDGNLASFGSNGFSNSLETIIDNGIPIRLILQTDNDAFPNYVDLDSDEDECFDVIEAGFLDPNNNGLLGSNVDFRGKVIATNGYIAPQPNYLNAGIISITTQPQESVECNLQNTKFSILTNVVDGYQWQVSADNELTYSNIANSIVYSGVTTNELQITKIPANYNNFKYRVYITKNFNTCGKFSDFANLKVNPVPVLIPNLTLQQCDFDSDNFSDFNLNQKNSSISTNYLNEDFSFYTDEDDAKNKDISTLIPNPEFFNSNSKTIYVRVENKITKCFSTTNLNLVVSIPPTVLANYFPEINECDDFLDQNGLNNTSNSDIDGISKFDLTPIKTEIFSKITNPTAYNIRFYRNSNDALLEFDASGNSLEIIDISNYRNIVSPNQQTVYARAENSSNNDCFGIIAVKLIVDKLPNIKISDKEIICLNLQSTLRKLTAGFIDNSNPSNFTYIWTKDNVVLQDEKNATIDVNLPGIYTVKVTTKTTTKCFRIRTITAIESDIATFQEPTVIDLVDENSVTINVTGAGIYEFAIDEENGIYQTSNVFANIEYGEHEFFVRDINNCGIVSQKINVIGAPKYFTPNADGTNDFWNIKGINAKNVFSNVVVYDKYGKLLKQFAVNSLGWDGKFNEQILPADDYWYVVELQDGRIAKGHFSLKR